MAEHKMKKEIRELEKRFEEEKAENKELKKSLDEMSYALEENIKKTEEEKRRKEEEIGDERNRREEELGKKLMEISELEERLCAEKNGKSKLKEELRLEREEKTRHRDRAMHKQREADDLNKEMENMSQRIAHLTEFKQRCVDILTGEAVDSTAVSEFTQMVAGDHYQMHVAVSLGVPWIVEEVRRNNTSLLKNKNKRGWTPFCLATARGDTRIMDQLWQSKKDLHMDPPLLHVAAMNCQHRAAKFLKGHVNKRTTYKGATASQVARLMGDKPLANEISASSCFGFCHEKPKHCDLNMEEIEELLLYRPSVCTRSATNRNSTTYGTTPHHASSSTQISSSPAAPSKLHGSNSITHIPLLTQDGDPTDVQGGISLNHTAVDENREANTEEKTEMGAKKRTQEDDEGEEREERERKSKKCKKEATQEDRKDTRQGENNEEEERMSYGTFLGPEKREEGLMIPEGVLTGSSLPSSASQVVKPRDEQVEKELPVGLPNLGNTCYMNSVMQCLYHTCTLAERLKKLENDKTLGKVLMATVKVMADLHYHRNMRESITHLKRVVGRKDSVYRDSEQKEAHDFLCQMLVWFDEDTTLSSKEGEEAEKNGKRVSFIASLFHGTHLSTITCEKEPKVDIITNEESFSNLSLTLTRPTTLEEALKQYYQPQGLEWDCDRCHTEHDCQHKISLTKAPPVLVLHLNRSSASPNSEHKLRVRYPLDLVVDVNSAGSSKRYYSLFAVCCHSGTMHSGHYTALCRTGEQWYHFNDTHVSPIALEDVLHKPAAHILFYEAKE